VDPLIKRLRVDANTHDISEPCEGSVYSTALQRVIWQNENSVTDVKRAGGSRLG
jgi:hypothetical protein